jgi:DNA polymerase III sliding clamp (beta) subunit (PCNA family)
MNTATITPTITLSISETENFRLAAKATAIAASTDAARDILACVKIYVGDGEIKFVATNTYMLFVTTIPMLDMPVGLTGEYMLRAKTLIDALPKKKGEPITLELNDESLTIANASTGAFGTVPNHPGTFPQWQSLITHEQAKAPFKVGFNPKYLGDICKAAVTFRGTNDNAPIALDLGGSELKPQHFTLHIVDRGTFYALIMPVRL